MERYFVMYDHSLFQALVQTSAFTNNTVTWVVASYPDLDDAMTTANLINTGKLDLFDVPGPWHKLVEMYESLLEEEMV